MIALYMYNEVYCKICHQLWRLFCCSDSLHDSIPYLEVFAICFTLQEGKRKFDKETTKFSQSLDRYLNMKQNKSNETQLLEVLLSFVRC